MKNIRYKITGLLFILIGLSGCAEDDFTTFQGEKSGIYMTNVSSTDMYGSVSTYIDSISFSFALYPSAITKLPISIPVRIMGNIKDYDRPFILKVDESKSTAKRGVHFDFEDKDCIIPANEAIKKVPITIYRTPDLATKTYRIEFYLEANEHFTIELEKYKNTAAWNAPGVFLNGSQFKISFNEFYNEPRWWSFSASNFFGRWSISKEKRVNAIMGWTHMDWEYWRIPYGRLPFAAKMLRKELQALADAGTPVLDDNGKYMQLVNPYEVDYSAYEM